MLNEAVVAGGGGVDEMFRASDREKNVRPLAFDRRSTISVGHGDSDTREAMVAGVVAKRFLCK